MFGKRYNLIKGSVKMKKLLCTIYYVIMALPIPRQLVSFVMALMVVAELFVKDASKIIGTFRGTLALMTIFFTGIYMAVYAYSLYKTVKNKKASIVTFLPIIFWALSKIFIYM